MKNNISGSFFGHWWLPETPNNKISGHLEISSSGETYFYTLDEIKPIPREGLYKLEEYCVLFGEATSIKDNDTYSFQLINLFRTGFSISDFVKRIFEVDSLLYSSRIKDKYEKTFSYLMMTSPSFQQFNLETGFSEIYDDMDSDTILSITKHEVVPPIDLFKNEIGELYVFFRSSATRSHNRKTFNYSEVPFLNFRFHKEKSFSEVLFYKKMFERLFSLVFSKVHFFSELKVRNTIEYSVYNGKSENHSLGEHNQYKFFIKNKDIILTNWFKIYDELFLIIDTFFFTFQDSKMENDNKFLQYVFVIELFHRKRFQDKRPLSKKNQNMYNKISKLDLPGDVKSYLDKFLNNDRDIPFKDRITEIFDKYDFGIPSILNKMSKKEFFNKIKDTRHHLVHLDDNKLANRISPSDMTYINNHLVTIIFSFLRDEIYNK